MLAFVVTNHAFAGHILNQQVVAPLPADTLPAPTDPSTDPVAALVTGPPAAIADGAMGAASASSITTGNARHPRRLVAVGVAGRIVTNVVPFACPNMRWR